MTAREAVRLSLLPPRAAWRADLRALEAIDVALGEAGGRRLHPQEQVVLGVLLLRAWGSHDALQVALWGNWLEPPESASSAIRVVVAALRKKLVGTGAVIVTLHGRGYRLMAAVNDDGDEGAGRHERE